MISTNDSLQAVQGSIFDVLNFWLNLYAFILTIIGVISGTFKLKELRQTWQTRHLRKVWGLKNKDIVVVVCSELDEAEIRQKVEDREYIYNYKYGDLDAYFEVIVSLLRLFPKIKLRIMSSGEAESSRVDLAQHLILIGGPDYNAITKNIISKDGTRFKYKGEDCDEQSLKNPAEIVIYDNIKKIEYCEFTEYKDNGYFERIKNPYNPEKNIILVGGCHTIGVTGAVKAFSMFESEQGEIPKQVFKNAEKVSKTITPKSDFAVLFSVERVGQTINTPLVNSKNILLKQ